DDAGAVVGTIDCDSRDAAERVARFRDERAFVGVDRVQAEVLDPIDGRVEPDGADDVRRSRLESSRRIEVRRLLECDFLDHRSAALPWRHLSQQFCSSPEATNAGWAVKLVSGERVEVRA